MSSLADLPEVVGFFSYSREDDEDFRGSLTALRDAIQRELRAQLGRNKRNFRLWQDQEAIAPGKDWEAEITRAVEQSVFFIPIVTPRAVGSDYCKFEFASFVARERALGRGDLVFPILYISVPALLDEAAWRGDPVLSVVAKRQYVDWRPFRHAAVASPEFGQAIERFCSHVVETLREPWLSPEERRQLEADAKRRAEEEERVRQDAEAKRRAEEEERLREEAEAKKRAEEEEQRRRLAEEGERQRRRIEAEARARADQSKQDAGRRDEVNARFRAGGEVARAADAGVVETREQTSTPRRPSRRDLAIAGVVGAMIAAGAAAWWSQHRPKEEVQQQTAVTAPAPVIKKEETHPPPTVAAPAPAAQPQTTTAPAPVAEKEETHPQASVTAPEPAQVKEESHAPATVTALTIAQERALKAGDSFKECANCPEMIVAPAGRFTMGSPAGQGADDEQPQHEVTIAKPFAAARFALTFDEWDACASHGDCKKNVGDEGWGRGRRPVINVNWDDAQIYLKWLSKLTGKPYRLLSESEYEYAARAGTQTPYPWGDGLKLNGKAMANCAGCGSQWDGKQTAPVGSFPANAFGLYDMAGNVRAWTEDCGNENYRGAPADGSPWTSGDCSRRVVRGGSWGDFPDDLRSADRDWAYSDYRIDFLGFRVARTLTP
ncbi:MAG: SUMF1/EgtB/PvdO family nonheme iron enzyme [Hyphomicrobiales bacterium]|nr:SUMF1/EgtB/PvdO family nonheme iron enzyme [Hyphomicrobiales bacterium]